MELHLPAHIAVDTRSSSNREHGIGSAVVVWAFHSDLTAREECRPVTLISCPNNRSDTIPIIRPHLLLIGSIKNGVCKRQEVTDRITFGPNVDDCIRYSMLNYMYHSVVTTGQRNRTIVIGYK